MDQEREKFKIRSIVLNISDGFCGKTAVNSNRPHERNKRTPIAPGPAQSRRSAETERDAIA
jgi:hypothetical protein